MGIWIDTDMGTDDILALLMVARRRSIDGVSLVFGVSVLDQVRRNAAGAVQAFGWEFPVYAGSDRSLLGDIETAENVLGPSGIRSRDRILPAADVWIPDGAVNAMSHWLESRREAELLALGPLTNLAGLAVARPDLLPNIDRIVWMGGGLTGGNHTPHAEFNAAVDPEALQILLDHRAPLQMIDLDACRQVVIDQQDIDTMSIGIEPSELLRDLLGGYLDTALVRGRSAMALYDPVAAAALLCPDRFSMVTADLEVELLDADTRGRTVVTSCPGGQGNVEIVECLDIPAIRNLFFSTLESRA